MANQIPSVETIRGRLEALTHAQMQELARDSGVPFTTLWKIRAGETKNPGIDTVRKAWAHLPERRKEVGAQ